MLRQQRSAAFIVFVADNKPDGVHGGASFGEYCLMRPQHARQLYRERQTNNRSASARVVPKAHLRFLFCLKTCGLFMSFRNALFSQVSSRLQVAVRQEEPVCNALKLLIPHRGPNTYADPPLRLRKRSSAISIGTLLRRTRPLERGRGAIRCAAPVCWRISDCPTYGDGAVSPVRRQYALACFMCAKCSS